MLQFRQKEIPQPQLLRWMQWFSRYNYQVKHIKGKDNIVADFLSRPQETSKLKTYSIMMMNTGPSSSNSKAREICDTTDPDFPPDLDCSKYPWDSEYLFQRRSEWEVKLFRNYGGHMLSPIGISPKYPFGHIFIARTTEPWPEELKWILWYLTHEYHILMEFHKPSLRKYWKHMSQALKDFLGWFAELPYWKVQIHKDPEYMIVHFHRPVFPVTSKYVSGYPEPFMEIYKQNNFTILEFEDHYSKAQRFIFAQNRIIPKEVWPRDGFHFDDHPEHEIYYERIKSAGNMHYYEVTRMNSQSPDELDFQDPFFMKKMEQEIRIMEDERKHRRTPDKSSWNKTIWREKRALAGMERWEWAAEQGISISDYSTESETISDEDSLMDLKFDGEWETFKRSQKFWDPSQWKGKRFKT